VATPTGLATRRKPGEGLIMAQVAVNEAVDQLLGALAEAWNAGDARPTGLAIAPT